MCVRVFLCNYVSLRVRFIPEIATERNPCNGLPILAPMLSGRNSKASSTSSAAPLLSLILGVAKFSKITGPFGSAYDGGHGMLRSIFGAPCCWKLPFPAALLVADTSARRV